MKVSKWSERLFGTPLFEPLVSFSYLFPLLYLVLFLIIPVLAMLLIAFSYNGHPSLHWFSEILGTADYIQIPPAGNLVDKTIMPGTGETLYVIRGVDFGIVLNSLIVGAIVTLLASVLGTMFAFLMARYDFRGKNFFRIALFIPLLVTPFVNAYVIKSMFSEYGFINYFLYPLLGFRLKLDGLAGVTLAQAITYYPIVYLNAYASFINIDPTLEEQAENLGSRGFHLFRTVTFPLALPGIAAGATLVFIFSLEDLAAPIVFHGDPLAKKLMSYEIFSKFLFGTGERSPLIAALSIIMLILAILAFLGIRKYVSLRQYAMISKGGRWKPRVAKPKNWQALIIYLIMLPLLIFTILPQLGVIHLAFSQEQTIFGNITGVPGEVSGVILTNAEFKGGTLPIQGFFQGVLTAGNEKIGPMNGTLEGFFKGTAHVKGKKVIIDGKISDARFQGETKKYGFAVGYVNGYIKGSGIITDEGVNITARINADVSHLPVGKKSGFTLSYIKQMLGNPDVRRYILNSLSYSLIAVIFIILLSITSSYATGRFKGALTPVLESIVILPIAVPGIVIAMGYFYFFHQIFPGTPFDPTNLKGFNPAYVLILAYSIRRLPFAARSVYAGLQQVHVSLEEASMNLGASRWKTITGILLPMISLNVFGGAMLSFVYAMSETSVGITLGSLNMEKAPITAFMKDVMMSAAGSVNIAAALGVLLITVQITSIVLVNVITKQRYSFIGLT